MEGPRAVRLRAQDFGAEDIGGHQVGCELDALFGKAENGAERFHQLGLGKAGQTDQQAVASRQDGDERALHHFLLPEDHLRYRFAHPRDVSHGLLGGGDDRLLFWRGKRAVDRAHAVLRN